MTRRKAQGDSGLEALRILKRRLPDVVYATLEADHAKRQPASAEEQTAATRQRS